jgi:hypothetical protein
MDYFTEWSEVHAIHNQEAWLTFWLPTSLAGFGSRGYCTETKGETSRRVSDVLRCVGVSPVRLYDCTVESYVKAAEENLREVVDSH